MNNKEKTLRLLKVEERLSELALDIGETFQDDETSTVPGRIANDAEHLLDETREKLKLAASELAIAFVKEGK